MPSKLLGIGMNLVHVFRSLYVHVLFCIEFFPKGRKSTRREEGDGVILVMSRGAGRVNILRCLEIFSCGTKAGSVPALRHLLVIPPLLLALSDHLAS